MVQLWMMVVIVEFVNLATILFGVFYLVRRTFQIRKLSLSSRSMHMYPAFRWSFVCLYLVLNMVQYLVFGLVSVRQRHIDQWLQELVICVGNTLNGIVLIGGLYVLRLEITRDKRKTHMHTYYNVFLIGISSLRLAEEVWIYFLLGSSEFNPGIIFQAIFVTLTIAMLVHKLMNNKYQDYFSEEIGINQLKERLKNGTVYNFDLEGDDQDAFPYLKVDVQGLTSAKISFAVFLKAKPFGIKTVKLFQLVQFYKRTQIFGIQNKLDLEGQLSVDDIEGFVDQLLSYWENYQSFVLDFFGIPVQMHSQWSNKVYKNKEESSEPQNFDSNSIYFTLSVTKMVSSYGVFQLLIEVATRSGKFQRQINKTLEEIDLLHQKLLSVNLRTRRSQLRLQLPQLPSRKNVIKDAQTLEQLRRSYEKYLRKIVNDRNIVKRYKQLRTLVYSFLGYPDAIQLSLRKESTIDYTGLSSRKARVTTKLNENNQPTTFYYFQIFQHDSLFRNIKKCLTEFDQLDFQIRRYLHNSHTEKFVQVPVLPPLLNQSLTQADKQDLHQQLNEYLDQLVSTFPDLSQIYEFKVFVNIKLEEDDSFVASRPLQKMSSEFSMERSDNLSGLQEELEKKIDNLGVDEFQMDIR